MKWHRTPVLVVLVTVSSSSLVPIFSPSLCNEGFIHDDSRGPLLLGTGFGSKPYQILYDKWTNLKNAKSILNMFSDEQAKCARILLEKMSCCEESTMNEAVFSGVIANGLTHLIPMFDKDGAQKSLAILHQTCVPDGSFCSVDIAIMDGSKAHCSSVHSLLDIKWKFDDEKFPESQGSAYAPLFVNAGSCVHRWLPVFVLSKDHYQFGVTFDGINARWAYSEICHLRCPRRDFTPGSDEDVLSILQFAQFFVETAIYHRDFKNEWPQSHLVDKSGQILLKYLSVVYGRVLRGFDNTGKLKILKLYADLGSASAALAKQAAIANILNYESRAELKEGCDSKGVSAVLDNFYPPAQSITIQQIVELANQVCRLHTEGFVHGDLRLPNIIFSEEGAVTLIDFEWSGKVGEAVFPARVSAAAFGPRARNFVAPGVSIDPLFDWMCLADLLDRMQCYTAAEAACMADVHTVIATIKTECKASGVDLFRLLYPARPTWESQFDLRALGLRFYATRRSAFRKEKQKTTSERNSLQNKGPASSSSNSGLAAHDAENGPIS